MHEVKKTVEVSIRLTPLDVAKAFCEFDQNQQSQVFNLIAGIVKTEWEEPFATQLQSITEWMEPDAPGRKIMAKIGEYAYQMSIDAGRE